MFFALFVVIAILWFIVAALHNLLAYHLSWHNPLTPRTHTVILRGVMTVRTSIHLLYWLLTVIVLVEATRQFEYLGVVWGMVFVIFLAGLGYFVVNQPSVQRQVLALVAGVGIKWGAHLGFIGRFLQTLEPLAKKLFREQPLFRDRDGLLHLMRQHHHTHRVLTPSQYRQLENLLEVESDTIATYVIPLKEAKMVRADDTVGPLLLTELHDSSRGAFGVYSKRRANIVGTIDQGVAVSHAKGGSKVTSLMDERIVFLPHNATLAHALQTFTETSSSLSVIIDENNTPTGVLYIQDIVRELFGESEENNENTHQPAR